MTRKTATLAAPAAGDRPSASDSRAAAIGVQPSTARAGGKTLRMTTRAPAISGMSTWASRGSAAASEGMDITTLTTAPAMPMSAVGISITAPTSRVIVSGAVISAAPHPTRPTNSITSTGAARWRRRRSPRSTG